MMKRKKPYHPRDHSNAIVCFSLIAYLKTIIRLWRDKISYYAEARYVGKKDTKHIVETFVRSNDLFHTRESLLRRNRTSKEVDTEFRRIRIVIPISESYDDSLRLKEYINQWWL